MEFSDTIYMRPVKGKDIGRYRVSIWSRNCSWCAGHKVGIPVHLHNYMKDSFSTYNAKRYKS